MLNQYLQIKKIGILFVVLLAISFGSRILLGLPLLFTKYEFGGIILFIYSSLLFRFSKKVIIGSLVYSLGIATLIILRVFTESSIDQNFIKVQWTSGLLLSSFFNQTLFLVQFANGKIKKLLINIVGFFVVLFILPIIGYWAYWGISGQLLQADIILAVCQTNLTEAISYLKEQSIFSIIITLIFFTIVVLLCFFFVNLLYKEKSVSEKRYSKFFWLGTLVIYLVTIGCGYKVVKISEPNILYKSVKESLEDYKKFGELRKVRESRLKALSGLSVQENFKGVYVVIIGESETRNHMSVYGYNKDTTPWLSEFAKKDGTLLFYNAYSNHTHTVPSLTYALSEKNQYNDIPLDKSNSIMEISKAAGMETYWLSNQAKYGVWDTPIAEIGSTATTQVWLNGSGGQATTTAYYDDKLVNEISKLKNVDNALIVVHLMGSHGQYNERYPASYAKFSGNREDIDSYDNSILFNDYVLSQIYQEISQNPNYKAMIMFSDHGEDVEEQKSHESSKFTYTMAKIPLVINFSDSYLKEHKILVNVLKTHESSYWTNDLLYDLLLSIMGIEGAPVVNPMFDLSSTMYDRTLDNIRTLHGKKKIIE